jgi:hypothetical protein
MADGKRLVYSRLYGRGNPADDEWQLRMAANYAFVTTAAQG